MRQTRHFDERNWVTACEDSLKAAQARRNLPRPVSPFLMVMLCAVGIVALLIGLVLFAAWLATK